jgi:ABC-type transport system substrate-binding protein
MPAVTPLRPGDPEQVGPYRLLGLIGEGGQGSVFLAEDTSGALAGRVAVKLLHARFTGDAKARARFAAEVKVAKRVSPFCTARILDADVEGHTPYIVSEFIDGPSLQAVLAEQGPQSGPALVRIAIGTITSLAAIHDAGIVHRDFKPTNVLMAPDGPRLIDFGVAKALDATGTLSSTTVGTPAYMAPEQIAGASVGPEADVFAWGASMVFAASGRPPFGQDSIPAVMHRILNLPADLGALPEPLREITAGCLSKDPTQRPSAFGVLLRLLRHAGAQPPPVDDSGPSASSALHQGAEVAAAPMPPTLTPAFWGAPTVPPPSPPPAPSPYDYPAGYRPDPRRRRRGVGALVSGGAAALVAMLAVAALLFVTLPDRTGGGPTPPVRVGGDFRMAGVQPTSLAPSNASWSDTDRLVVKLLFTGLVEIHASGAYQGRLATDVTGDANCRNWTITLRAGTRFHNGDPVDAESVIRGWTRSARAPESLSSFFMSDIDGYARARDGNGFRGVRELGEHRLSVRLTEPNCEFPKRLANPVFFPVPPTAGEHDNADFNKRPIGNGPFRLESYDENSQIVLVRNESWEYGKANLERVTIKLDSSTAVSAIHAVGSGELDWATVPPENVTAARSVTAAELVSRPSAGLNFLAPITTKGPMSKREARQAVSYALDRRAISETYAHGVYPPATGLVPAAFPGFSGSSRCASCGAPDPVRAKSLATQAGLGSDSRVRLLVSQDSSYHRWGELVKDQLERTLGWQIELRVVKDLSARIEALKSDDITGLVPLGWVADYGSPYSFLQPLLGAGEQPPDGANYARWRNRDFDSALNSAVTTQTPAVMQSSFQQAEKVALDDMALIPVLNLAHVRLVSKKFVNLTTDFDGDPTLVTASLRPETQHRD